MWLFKKKKNLIPWSESSETAALDILSVVVFIQIWVHIFIKPLAAFPPHCCPVCIIIHNPVSAQLLYWLDGIQVTEKSERFRQTGILIILFHLDTKKSVSCLTVRWLRRMIILLFHLNNERGNGNNRDAEAVERETGRAHHGVGETEKHAKIHFDLKRKASWN